MKHQMVKINPHPQMLASRTTFHSVKTPLSAEDLWPGHSCEVDRLRLAYKLSAFRAPRRITESMSTRLEFVLTPHAWLSSRRKPHCHFYYTWG
jgi:hypothetical protein